MANRVRGKVTRLYVRREATNVRLDIPAAEQPPDGYFRLSLTNPNYNSLYSLALSSAINRNELLIRTVGEITPTETPEVEYMVVDW